MAPSDDFDARTNGATVPCWRSFVATAAPQLRTSAGTERFVDALRSRAYRALSGGGPMMPEGSRAEVVDALERAPSLIVPLVLEVPEHLRKRRPSPGKWSAHEHACHLAAVQPIFFERLALMLDHDHPAIRSYQPEREHLPDALLDVDLEEALGRFQRERTEMVARLRRLQPEEWRRTADHEEYSHYSVFIMFRHVALHDMLHTYRIEECLLKKEWA